MYYILAWLGFAALTYLYAWWDTNYFYRRWNVKIPRLWDSLFEH